MRTSRRYDPTQAIGTDAFLDIVANLIGIFLILIMVIGVRMDDASQNARISAASLAASSSSSLATAESMRLEELPEPPVELPDAAPAQQEVARLETSIREAESEAADLENLTRLQKLDRDNLMLAVTTANLELERRRDKLDQQQQQRLALRLALRESTGQYQSLIEEIDVAKQAAEKPKPEVIQHIATPMAQTVFIREEHFRLKQGRLSYVPLNEMTEQLRNEAPKKLWKLKNTTQITETIGPRDGFYLRYTLRRNRIPISTGAGLTAREVVELDRFVMIPVGNEDGESVDGALQLDSAFRTRLEGWNPNDTIITVWTYPDSFRAFRQIKQAVYKLGFLTAARPLPENQLISGSPNGTRSAAQ